MQEIICLNTIVDTLCSSFAYTTYKWVIQYVLAKSLWDTVQETNENILYGLLPLLHKRTHLPSRTIFVHQLDTWS